MFEFEEEEEEEENEVYLLVVKHTITHTRKVSSTQGEKKKEF